MPPQEYVQNSQFCLVKMIDDHETKLSQDPGHTHLTFYVNDY